VRLKASQGAHMRTLFRGGTVVSASGEYRSDVLLEGEQVLALGTDLGLEADVVVDAGGALLLPGLVDSHTHIGSPDPGKLDAFRNGTRGAVLGGTTAIVDFAMQSDGSLLDGLQRWRAQASAGSYADYGFHMIIDDVTPAALAEMARLVEEGVTSFKVFLSGAKAASDEDVLRVLRQTTSTGGLVQVHAENGDAIRVNVENALASGRTEAINHATTRPRETELEAVERAIHLGAWARRPIFFVHISTKEAVQAIGRARAGGQAVHAETCVHYLVLAEDRLMRPGVEGAKYMCAPPLRTEADQRSLWSGLRQRLLSACTTDHCAHSVKGGKDRIEVDFAHVPNGLPSIQHRLVLLYEYGVRQGRITLPELVTMTATSPARLFDIPGKGEIAPGMDADIVLFDPEGSTLINASGDPTGVDYSPYEGEQCRGSIVGVYRRGSLIVDRGEVLASPGDGRYLHRGFGAFGPGDRSAL
jgi:dihydropyrimidinase